MAKRLSRRGVSRSSQARNPHSLIEAGISVTDVSSATLELNTAEAMHALDAMEEGFTTGRDPRDQS